ncbi:MAG: Gfo/Idh/MocA family oxidoreductase [Firmicutes bacterium]|nr:Gfo/Idh/MocA family oxidoreductase [Bacillota bacterium]
MEKKKLKWGIVGCGVIAPAHGKSLAKTKDAELVAVCDIVRERAEHLAADFGNPAVYTDLDEMLEHADLDILSVCTPSGMHGEHITAAAERGVHVLSEKPLEITLKKVDSAIQACRKAGVKLGGVFQRRTFPTSVEIKKALDAGALGKMVLGTACLKYYRDQAYYDSGDWRGTWELDGGGALMNQGVHGIDLLLWFMGDVRKVFARTGTLLRDIPVEDTAVVSLEFASGAFGTIEGTTSVYPGMDTRIELHGERGTIILEESRINTWKTLDGVEREQEVIKGEGAKVASDPSALGPITHDVLVQDMIDAVKADREPLIPGEEARKAVELILAIYESAKTGKEITLL